MVSLPLLMPPPVCAGPDGIGVADTTAAGGVDGVGGVDGAALTVTAVDTEGVGVALMVGGGV
jgi:hypothetical protein